jgi:hypothetical protein
MNTVDSIMILGVSSHRVEGASSMSEYTGLGWYPNPATRKKLRHRCTSQSDNLNRTQPRDCIHALFYLIRPPLLQHTPNLPREQSYEACATHHVMQGRTTACEPYLWQQHVTAMQNGLQTGQSSSAPSNLVPI